MMKILKCKYLNHTKRELVYKMRIWKKKMNSILKNKLLLMKKNIDINQLKLSIRQIEI